MKHIVILFLLFSSLCVYGQEFVETVNLQFKSYQKNYSDLHFSTCHLPKISKPNFEIDCPTLKDKEIHFLSFGLSWVYPNYSKDESTKSITNKFQPTAIIIDRKLESSSMMIDCNSDGSFCDEEAEEITLGLNNKIIEVEFFDRENALSFPILLKMNLLGKSPEVTISRPYIYTANIPQISENEITIFTSLESMYFFVNKGKGHSKKIVSFVNEPFEYQSSFYKLTNINLINKSIDLYQFGAGDKPIGTKKGLFLEKKEVVKSINALPEFKENINESNLIVLHFWADWCQPCIDQMPRVKVLEKRITSIPDVTLVNSIVALDDKENNRISNFLKKHDLVETNYITPLSIDGEETSIAELCKLADFPTFIMLDTEGKIIERTADVEDILIALSSF